MLGIVHVHSDYSHDGRDSLERLATLSRERGLAFVCLTDHAEDLTPADFDRYRDECEQYSGNGVRLIPGLEFRFDGFPGLHLLALDLGSWIQPVTPDAFVEVAPRAAGLTIIAHPKLARYRLPDSVRHGIQAVEVWNPAYDTRYLPDPRAFELFMTLHRDRQELLAVAGLDQHDASNDRRTRVVLQNPWTEDPVAELRAGRFINQGLTMSFGARPAWGGIRLNALKALRRGLTGVEGIHDAMLRGRRRWARKRGVT